MEPDLCSLFQYLRPKRSEVGGVGSKVPRDVCHSQNTWLWNVIFLLLSPLENVGRSIKLKNCSIGWCGGIIRVVTKTSCVTQTMLLNCVCYLILNAPVIQSLCVSPGIFWVLLSLWHITSPVSERWLFLTCSFPAWVPIKESFEIRSQRLLSLYFVFLPSKLRWSFRVTEVSQLLP